MSTEKTESWSVSERVEERVQEVERLIFESHKDIEIVRAYPVSEEEGGEKKWSIVAVVQTFEWSDRDACMLEAKRVVGEIDGEFPITVELSFVDYTRDWSPEAAVNEARVLDRSLKYFSSKYQKGKSDDLFDA